METLYASQPQALEGLECSGEIADQMDELVEMSDVLRSDAANGKSNIISSSIPHFQTEVIMYTKLINCTYAHLLYV